MQAIDVVAYMNPPTYSDDDDDTWHVLQTVTNTSRANIIADIVGHPKGAPSVQELDITNPSLEADTIRGHLSVLKDAGVVEELVIPVGERTRGLPYKFYRLTDRAQTLFDRNNLFPEEAWKRAYERIAKSPELRKLEAMPRPAPSSDGGREVHAD